MVKYFYNQVQKYVVVTTTECLKNTRPSALAQHGIGSNSYCIFERDETEPDKIFFNGGARTRFVIYDNSAAILKDEGVFGVPDEVIEELEKKLEQVVFLERKRKGA